MFYARFCQASWPVKAFGRIDWRITLTRNKNNEANMPAIVPDYFSMWRRRHTAITTRRQLKLQVDTECQLCHHAG